MGNAESMVNDAMVTLEQEYEVKIVSALNSLTIMSLIVAGYALLSELNFLCS